MKNIVQTLWGKSPFYKTYRPSTVSGGKVIKNSFVGGIKKWVYIFLAEFQSVRGMLGTIMKGAI